MMKRLIPALLGLVAGSAMAAASVGKAAPDFTLSDLSGKTVKLQGYLIPLEAGQTHKSFLLSAWSPTCPFCQTAGPEAMVEVRARQPVKYSIDPIVVEGRFLLLDNDASGMFYRLLEAVPSRLP